MAQTSGDTLKQPTFVPLRSELKRLTRERLVSVAMRLFESEGFRAISVARIVQEAGTTAPTFYRHFKSKSELMWLVSDYLTDKVTAALLELDKIKRPTRAALRDWIGVYGEMWQRAHLLCAAYWEATAADAELAADAVPGTLKVAALMTNYLSGMNAKTQAKMKVRLTIVTLLMDRFMYISQCAKGSEIHDAMLDEFADMLWQILFDRGK